MKNTIIKLIIGVALLFFGWKIFALGDGYTSDEDIAEMEDNCTNVESTEGVLKDEYSTLKVKNSTVMYTFTYEYTVDDKNYTIPISSKSLTLPSFKEIWYNSKNPEIASIENPCESLKRLKEQKSIGNRWLFYIPGGIMAIIGLLLSWGNFKHLIFLLLKKLFGSNRK